MAPYKILKQGYIMKEPPASKRGLRKKLYRYWFVLVEDPQQVALVYFKNEDAYIARQRNEGFIRVDNSISINVISEHLGHKNAFVIKSVRTDYTMVPESRYDLHEWLFTLHNAIEAFKLKQRKAEERRRMPLRLRANTVDSINVPPSPGGSLRTTTPTRRAPPAPPTAAAATAATGQAGQTGSITRRKPVRPAPVAPGPRRSRSQSHSQPMSPMSSGGSVGGAVPRRETPPPAYSDTSSVTPVELHEARGVVGRGSPRMSESSEHPIMDLNISHMDRDEYNQEMEEHPSSEGGQPHPLEEGQPHPLTRQSASDTLLLMHQNSASLPDLMSCEVQGSLTNGGVALEGVVRDVGGAIRQRSVSDSRHTRSLSLTGTEDIHAKRPPRDRKKRSARRNGSIKLRSRSPPNLPPPPPPPTTMGQLREETSANAEGLSTDEVDHSQSAAGLGLSPLHIYGGALTTESSTTNVGFSEVMNTISHIDHELDEIVVSPVMPSVPAPKRTASATAAQSTEPGFTIGEADDDFNEEEWLCDVPEETTPISPPKRPTPEGGPPSAEEDNEPEAANFQQQRGEFVPADQLVSSGFIPAAVVEGGKTTSDPRPKTKGKNRVMFKEEVEDIPSYEPRVDHEFGNNQDDDEEIPTGVAALKKKLFGEKEKETARYRKEGIMSPRYTHPENMTFEAGYKFDDSSTPFFRESSPNVNNNNGADREQAKPRLTDQQEGGVSTAKAVSVIASTVPAPQKSKRVQEGLYDPPWEQSSVSKYKVIGRMRAESFGKQTTAKEKTPSTAKEKTPPPVSPKTKKGIQFGEVSTTETPKPGSMEIRNVHSLERSKKNRIHQSSLDRPPAEKKPSPSSSPARSYSLDRAPTSPGRQDRTLTSPGVPAAVGDESLLDSITDTLQKHSKYGSITILSPPSSRMSETEPSKSKKVPNEVRRSSRGELEKIRAAHRREPPPPPMGVAPPPVTTPTRASPKNPSSSTHSSPQRTSVSPQGSSAHSSPHRSTAAVRTSPQGMFTVPASRTSPQGPNMMPAATRSSPQNQLGATVAQPTVNSAHFSWQSPSHSSPKQSAHYSSQILTSPAHRSGQAKRRMFSGRPRMAASLDELQTDPSTQVTYDATAKTHIFRSLV